MAPLSARFRTPLAVLTAAALTVSGAVAAQAVGPGTALAADGLAVGSITTSTVVGDFTITASSTKNVSVDASALTSDRGDVYSQRIKLNGTGDATARSLAFTVDDAAHVLIHARSGSATADRSLALYDATGAVVDTVPAAADDPDQPVATQVLDVPSAGAYRIASPASGVNVYYAEITDGSAPERAPWADVAAPVVDGVGVDEDDPTKLVVRYTGLLGADGADIAHALLYDADGTVVDRAFTATDGTSGSIALTPPASGTYQVEVQLTRSGETDALSSGRAEAGRFDLPLGAPQVTGALTTAVTGGKATVTVDWTAVAEAQTYEVQTGTGGDYTTAVDGVTATSAQVTGLTPGATYQVRVVAHRGDDAATSPPYEVAVAAAVERWKTTEVGSNANSGGSVKVNDDGTITFDAKASSTKLATSEDGFQYFYTQVDPATENFTLDATFRVDDASTADNQSGFGVLAVDDMVPGDGTSRYLNSAGALVTRYGEGTATITNGTPGARFVSGYTGAPNDATAGARDASGSRVFDPNYRPDAAPLKFATGDVYKLSLRRSNTGFHAIWHRDAADGGDVEVIDYDPDLLLKQDPDTFYVGLAVARKIVVTVTDWDFTTVAPGDDDPAQEQPTTYVPATLDVDVTATTPRNEIEVPLVANMHGTGQILAADGTVVVDDVALAPGERVLVPLTLEDGKNTFTARLLPDAEQPQLGDHEAVESTDPVDVPLTFTVHRYGKPGQSIRVTPDGRADGDGTAAKPLDLHTAVAYAQAGQQIVLAGGTYRPTTAVVADRGHDGTKDAPITLMSEPGKRAVLDLTQSSSGGIDLRADWWHVYDLEITGSGDKEKPMLIGGNHNVVERVESHHNQDTGIQISGSSTEPPSMWPSDNLVVSSVSHDNADPGGNDADGFAAKLTVGAGNVFRHDISHHNIDDGWDLYAKSTTGPIGTVVIEDSVAYDNGRLSDAADARTGEGNGFKLGGESIPGDHLLRNSVTFGNLGTGVTSNSGPNVRVQQVTSVGNDRGIRLETNAATTDFRVAGMLSYRSPNADLLSLKQPDTSLLTDPSNYFDGATKDASDGRPATVSDAWFVSTDTGVAPTIAADGSVDLHGLFELTDVAPGDTGARLTGDGTRTTIEVLPPVTAPLANVTAPTIRGAPVVGATLAANSGTWSAAVHCTYQWLRDGKPIAKAVGRTYVVRTADAGHRLSVAVTASATGSDPVVATSAPVTARTLGDWLRGVVGDLIDWLKQIFGPGHP
ncbi:fibronectin type III domain-containing protein [Cellulomonas sp. JH27-2]|uniref:fibronectin type III domain-containing protein n=1 Tax=Cellulomonas sp. JH27-2 TaxID=2774139 RepID=UPI00177D2374|nr:fibronectin type III domain-containing protein [Cellulomonas sp. JH27-2]MBD8057599.1 fibronectin type III domain-containing protein [Cellulomonas sp. JH27-2]